MSHILATSEDIYIESTGDHFFSFLDEGNQKEKNTTTITVIAPNASVYIHGRIRLHTHQQSQWNIHVVLSGSHQSASLDIKAVVDDMASVVLNAGVTIAKSSSDCRAHVHEKVILFSPHAKARVTPQLCVQTQQVESASHSASVAPFSEELFFFLATKGISKEAAKTLLVNGFFT